MAALYENIRSRRIELGMSQQELADRLGYKSRSAVNKIELGINELTGSKIKAFADALDTTVGELMGYAEKYAPPVITEDFVTFPVIGDIAAGYDHTGVEDWNGDTAEIPVSYLKGHDKKDFFVLRVKGSSMYPMYHDGDKVLILKQSTLDHSGEVGAIIYDDEFATLKKVEYTNGEDWLKLVPINPNYEPEMIENERLEHCRVIGVPRLLIRELN